MYIYRTHFAFTEHFNIQNTLHLQNTLHIKRTLYIYRTPHSGKLGGDNSEKSFEVVSHQKVSQYNTMCNQTKILNRLYEIFEFS